MKVVSTILVLAGLAVSSVAMASPWDRGGDGWGGGGRRRSVGWVYVNTDRNGCSRKTCQYTIRESYPNSCYNDVWNQLGHLCRDWSDRGRIVGCRQYGTNNNDEQYKCQ